MKTAVVRMNPALIDAMFKGKYFSADCETIWNGKRIYLVPDAEVLNRRFTVKGSEDPAVIVPATARLLY